MSIASRTPLGNKLHVGLIVAAALLAALVVTWIARERQQTAAQNEVDFRIATEMNALIESDLRRLSQSDPVLRRCGAFRSWHPQFWQRIGQLEWRPPRLNINGTAHFEHADVQVMVAIGRGPKSVEFTRFPTDSWLKEHPHYRLTINGRRLTGSESPSIESYCFLEAAAKHPAFDESVSSTSQPHSFNDP